MARKKRNWINSPWTISIGTAIFTLILTIGYDFLKEKPVLTTIWGILSWIGNLLWTILNFDLKVWWLIVAVIALFLIALIIAKFEKEDKEEKLKPDFCDYREGRFKNWRWTWEWSWSDYRRCWLITDLNAHCPKCDTTMIEHSSGGLSFECPRCEFQAFFEQCEAPHKIERIILDNIDREEAMKKRAKL